jgi:hypothetical protein
MSQTKAVEVNVHATSPVVNQRFRLVFTILSDQFPLDGGIHTNHLHQAQFRYTELRVTTFFYMAKKYIFQTLERKFVVFISDFAAASDIYAFDEKEK